MRLEVRELARTFADGTRALDGTSLSLSPPCFIVLSGKNGSGKSMLIRHVMGLEKADSGGVYLDGVPLARCLAELRRRVALVFQEPEHQILGITVREDMEFGLSPREKRSPAVANAVADSLARCGLSGRDDRLCSTLSGGEKRRLAIASALVKSPELVILDEPFNDLDWAGASDLIAVLLSLREAGTGVLVVTHDLEKCLAHADRLVVMEAGRVALDGHPAELWDELPSLGLRRPDGGAELLADMTWRAPESRT